SKTEKFCSRFKPIIKLDEIKDGLLILINNNVDLEKQVTDLKIPGISGEHSWISLLESCLSLSLELRKDNGEFLKPLLQFSTVLKKQINPKFPSS
ncbi:MAG: hypothetical protein J7M18_05855, partial [Candidatus Eremiobacteraeota bacterium]|nr:hypothetical protein [Candidatus Eremiobacteraeota bacterium]